MHTDALVLYIHTMVIRAIHLGDIMEMFIWELQIIIRMYGHISLS